MLAGLEDSDSAARTPTELLAMRRGKRRRDHLSRVGESLPGVHGCHMAPAPMRRDPLQSPGTGIGVRPARPAHQGPHQAARPGDIAVIDHVDLDRVSAEALVACQVVAVVNVAPSIPAAIPTSGRRS